MGLSFLIYKNGGHRVIEDCVKDMKDVAPYKVIDVGGAVGWGPHNVTRFPTTIVLSDGKEIARTQGFNTVEQMRAWLEFYNLVTVEALDE